MLERRNYMNVFYSNLAWYGDTKKYLLAQDLTIDLVSYGNVIMDVDTNVFAKQVLDYADKNNIEIEVLDIPDFRGQTTSSEEMIQTAVVNAVQGHLDVIAKQKNYDDALSISTYATSTDEIFASEAKKFIEYRDKCWRKCYDMLAQYLRREIALPTPDDVLAQLPEFSWDE